MQVSLATLATIVTHARVLSDRLGHSVNSPAAFDHRWQSLSAEQKGDVLQAVDELIRNGRVLALADVTLTAGVKL